MKFDAFESVEDAPFYFVANSALVHIGMKRDKPVKFGVRFRFRENELVDMSYLSDVGGDGIDHVSGDPRFSSLREQDFGGAAGAGVDVIEIRYGAGCLIRYLVGIDMRVYVYYAHIDPPSGIMALL